MMRVLTGAGLPLDELERRYLLYILEVAGGNRTRAAEILGIDRRTLYRMIERYGIDKATVALLPLDPN